MKIHFWFEFASTYSYPAAMRIERLAASRGIRVVWRAFLLGPIFRDHGMSDSPFNLNPVKGRYMWRDLGRICDGEGIAFRRPSLFPRNGLLAARVACRFHETEWLPRFVRAVYGANFAEDLEISSEKVVAQCLAPLVDDPAQILDAAQTGAAKARLRAQTEEAVRLGIFGAPSFIVGDELFWGNDRLEQALDWAIRGRS